MIIDLNIVFMFLNPQAHGEMHLTYVFLLPPFVRITGIRFYGYNLSPCFLGTPLSFDRSKVMYNLNLCAVFKITAFKSQKINIQILHLSYAPRKSQ